MLELPPTVSLLNIEDYKESESVGDEIIKSHCSKIVEGYTIISGLTDNAHKFYAEVNVDNKRLWLLIKAIVAVYPEEVALIYHHRDDEPHYGRYLDKYELLNDLEEFKTELVQDGNLMFGIINDNSPEGFLEEVFVERTKYLKCWGMDADRFKLIMENFNIYPVEGLNFIDEFPHKTVPLTIIRPDLLGTMDLIGVLNDHYEIS